MKQENKNFIDLQKNDSSCCQETPKQAKKENFFKELIKFALLSAIVVLPIRLFIAQPVMVSGGSMNPTFADKQYLIVDQITYKFHDPEREDTVIFHYPKDPSKFFIKRVIGLPGETVILRGSTARIINDEHPDGFTLDESFLTHVSENNDSLFELGPDEYVVLGDNRTASSDSRSWGTVHKQLIVGRALLRLYPFNSIDILPGEIPLEKLQHGS